MNYTHQKKIYRARCLQWTVDNFEKVAAVLYGLGYDTIDMHGDTIMARSSAIPLLCVHKNNWLRIGENNTFKVMRPDEFELKYEAAQACTKLERYDDPVNAVEELYDQWAAIQQTLDENGHLADGDNCTLIALKRTIESANLSGETV